MGTCSAWTGMRGPDLLQSAHDDPFVGLQPLGDHSQAVILERGRGDAAVLDLVVLVDHVDELDSLVGADGLVDHQDGGMGFADRQANPHEHARARAAGCLPAAWDWERCPAPGCFPWSG